MYLLEDIRSFALAQSCWPRYLTFVDDILHWLLLVPGLFVGRYFLSVNFPDEWDSRSTRSQAAELYVGGVAGNREEQYLLSPNEEDDRLLKDLAEAKERISRLEKKVALVENRTPKRYPFVNFLNHRAKKRILVTTIHRNNSCSGRKLFAVIARSVNDFR